MVSQVIAWCTVSVMLLRKGMNQVNAVAQQSSPLPLQPYSNDSNAYEPAASAVHEDARDYDSATIGVSVTATDTGHHYETPPKSFDNGGPAVVAGIVMITIAVIMLIISPTIMLLKIIEKRKKRILDAVRLLRHYYNNICGLRTVVYLHYILYYAVYALYIRAEDYILIIKIPARRIIELQILTAR